MPLQRTSLKGLLKEKRRKGRAIEPTRLYALSLAFALSSEIETVIPIDTAKSIDESTCRLDESGRVDPRGLSAIVSQDVV